MPIQKAFKLQPSIIIDYMSNRTTSNKYELFINEVRKIAKKKDPLNEEEEKIKKVAMLIAALSSSHSWQTYQYLHGAAEYDKTAIQAEAGSAFAEGWKAINEVDAEEVVTSEIPEQNFSMWLFFTVPKEERQELKEMLVQIKNDLKDGLETVEKKDQ